MRFVKIYEDIDKWQWYQDSRMVHLFIHLILHANYQDGYFRGTLIKRGQIAVGRKSLSNSLGMSEMQVRERLRKLSDAKYGKEITIKTTNHFSVITLCNYEKYQTKQPTKQPTDNQPITNQQPTDNQPITTIEEVIEVIERKEVKEINNSQGAEQKSSALSKTSDMLYQPMMTIYYDWVKNKIGVPPKIDGAEGKALKSIITYFRNINSDEEEIKKAWAAVFLNYSKWDKFYQAQLKLTQINFNLINIINSIHNGKPNNAPQTPAEQLCSTIQLAKSRRRDSACVDESKHGAAE